MATVTDLLRRYRQAAIVHGTASDPRVGNAAHDELGRIRRNLFAAVPSYCGAILKLLEDENVHVRLVAGFDALTLAPEDGLRVLRAIAAGPEDEVQFHAEMILEQWNKGELDLQPWRHDDR